MLFMACELSRPEVASIVRHLLKGCPECSRRTRQLWRFGDEALLKLPKKGVPAEAADVPASPETPI